MVTSKLRRIFIILEALHHREVDSYDEVLLEKFGISHKQLGRLLEEVESEIEQVVEIRKGRKKVWRLINPIDIINEIATKSDDLGWFYQLAVEGDPEVFGKLAEFTQKESHIYQFLTTPFEDTKELEAQQKFTKLKEAIKDRRRVDITFVDKKIEEAKPIKLIMMKGNWYIAYIHDKKVRIGRISFIESVTYAFNDSRFRESEIQKELEFLNTIQNPFTLYNKERKRAIIKAQKEKAHYFKADMKSFFPSQKFIKECEDGSVHFSIDYTQEMEILPFIQEWIPSLEIVEPQELKERFIKKLQKMISCYS